jgi:hypothetical protein
MRVSIVSVFLAGGILALGACSTAGEPPTMTLAERTRQCERVIGNELVPSGRETGNPRNDYDCRSRHAASYRPSTSGSGGPRSVGAARALRGW